MNSTLYQNFVTFLFMMNLTSDLLLVHMMILTFDMLCLFLTSFTSDPLFFIVFDKTCIPSATFTYVLIPNGYFCF